MEIHYEAIRDLIRTARARWLALSVFHAAIRGALAAAAVLLVAVLAVRVGHPAPVALAAIGAAACVIAVAAIAWATAPLRFRPSDLRVARFIEERAPSLDDRLVTAVDVANSGRE